MPIYYIHHPSGNVVIRTDNAYIVIWHQMRGWLTTTSFSDVLHDHPEWSSAVNTPLPPRPQDAFQRPRICEILTSPLRSLFRLYSGICAGGIFANPPQNLAPRDEDGEAPIQCNCGPIHWMTALEREWCEERVLEVPVAGWIRCAGNDGEFEYRLESGKWPLRNDVPPSYASSTKRE